MEVFPQQFYENSSLWALTMKVMILFAVSFDCLASSSSCYSSTTTIQGCLLFRGVKDVQRSNFQIPTQMIWSLVRNKKKLSWNICLSVYEYVSVKSNGMGEYLLPYLLLLNSHFSVISGQRRNESLIFSLLWFCVYGVCYKIQSWWMIDETPN